ARRTKKLERTIEVAPDQVRRMRIGGERDRNVTGTTLGEKLGVRIELTHRFVESRSRHLDGNAGIGDRGHDRPVVERGRTRAEDLHEIGMRQRLEEATPRSRRERLEVDTPSFVD